MILQENETRMQKLVDKLKSRVDIITKGGGEKAVSRHTSKGKYFMMWLNNELIRYSTEATNSVFTIFKALQNVFFGKVKSYDGIFL